MHSLNTLNNALFSEQRLIGLYLIPIDEMIFLYFFKCNILFYFILFYFHSSLM